MKNHLSILTPKLIQKLLSIEDKPCLSLYMPTHIKHPENAKDPILFKNLVQQLKESLLKEYPDTDIQELLTPFEKIVGNKEFWNHTTEGLAILCAPNTFEVICLQEPVEELAIVADSFHTRPLRRFLQTADRHQVLALSLDSVHLFEGNRHSLVEIELPDDFPKSMEEALGKELTDKHLTVASYGGSGGDGSNMHHGHGGKKAELDIDAERFFRLISDAIENGYSKPTGLPLILAALPEHHHLFHQVSSNSKLIPTGIELNPQSVSKEELAELSWKVMEPLHLKTLDTLIAKFNTSKSSGHGSDNIEYVVKAAETGRVETLLIESHRIIAKRLRNIDGTYKVTDVTQPKLDDLLDDIGELASAKGASVVIIPKEQMPTGTGLAAIFRY